MTHDQKKRKAFRPALSDASLEDRVVLATITGPTSGALITIGSGPNAFVQRIGPLTPALATSLTPPPASPPFTPGVTLGTLTAAQLRTALAQQIQAASTSLNSAVAAQVRQLFTRGVALTPQQMSNLQATIGGLVNATALRLSTQASLLPGGATRLAPAIQNALLGSGANSLTSRLTSLIQSQANRVNVSVPALQSAVARQIGLATQSNNNLANNFFNTTNLNALSVNSQGRRIPLQQFVGGQLVNQLGNSMGLLSQNFSTVANSMLFPNGTTATPSQSAINAFSGLTNNALNTAAFQLSSGLSLLPQGSNLARQLQPLLFGSSTATNNFASALQNLPYGTTGFNTAATGAFNTAFQNFQAPLNSFLGLQGQTNSTVPTTGLTGLFGSQFGGNGFNNGFLTGNGNTGFAGFGQAPSAFNTNFAAGFNNYASTLNQNLGFSQIPGNINVGTGQ